MPSVYLFSSNDPKNSTYKEELALSLQREGITVESTLINCQIVVLLQTVETAQLPHVRQLLKFANRLIQQQRLKEVVRFVCEEIESLPEAWEMITPVDATENRGLAAQQLAQFILRVSNPNSTSSTSAVEELVNLFPPGSISNSGSGELTNPVARRDESVAPKELDNPFEGDEEPTVKVGPSQVRKEWQLPVSETEKLREQPLPPIPPPSPAQPPVSRPEPLRSLSFSDAGKPVLSRISSLPRYLKLYQVGSLMGGRERRERATAPGLQRWWPVAAVCIILLIALPIMPSLFTHKSQPVAAQPAPQTVGSVYFFSSGMIDVTNSKGLNDGLQIDLLHLAAPNPSMQYYGWLLSDLDKFQETPVSLGPLSVQNGTAHLRFVDPMHTDLLAKASRFLITEESASLPPVAPSSDRSAWRYYAELPQQPGQESMDGMHLSFLDHLRHLLVDDPDMAAFSAHGGLAFWATENTRKILEWANAARNTGMPQSPDLMHKNFIRILDCLDGVSYVQQDLPAHTPFLADQTGAHFGLLTLDSNANPPGYLESIAMHLEGMVSSPGATSTERTLVGRLDTALAQTRNSLNQARQDSIKLVNTPLKQLQSAASTELLDDLVLQANNAYIGLYDPQTGNRTQGITWVTDQIQYLSAFEVKPYTPDQTSSSQPVMKQTPMNSQTPTMKSTSVGGQMPGGSPMATPQATAKRR